MCALFGEKLAGDWKSAIRCRWAPVFTWLKANGPTRLELWTAYVIVRSPPLGEIGLVRVLSDSAVSAAECDPHPKR